MLQTKRTSVSCPLFQNKENTLVLPVARTYSGLYLSCQGFADCGGGQLYMPPFVGYSKINQFVMLALSSVSLEGHESE